MGIGRLMVYRQLVLTFILVVLFWILYARLYRQEFFRWWGLAWTSFAAYLAITAFVLRLAPEWTFLKSSLVLFSVLARSLQLSFLLLAASSMRSKELRLRRWAKPGVGIALIVGALSFAASFLYREQPLISLSFRSLPYTLGLAAASSFYAFCFFERWQRHRSSSAAVLAGSSCVLYALNQGLYSVSYIISLIGGPDAILRWFLKWPSLAREGVSLPQSFDLPLLVPPGVLLLEGLSSVGLCIGMMLLVIEGYHQAESALQEIAVRRRQLAESDAALLAEINERKSVEQALKENEDRYHDLVEHSKDLLCTHDLEGRLLSINPAPARVLGYEVKELLKIPMTDLLVPSFRDRFDAYLKRIRKKGEAFGLMRVLTRTGEERIWEYHNTLYTEGVPSPIVRGIAHDVTEKIQAEQHSRQSEAMFATAFRSNPCAMLISTLAEGQFIDVNVAFERQTGYNRDEVIGLTALQLGLCANATEWKSIAGELQSGTGVKNRELQLRTKSNNFLMVSYSAEIIELLGRSCVLAVAEDITARKQVEEKLRDLRSHLVRAQEEERARIARELHDDVSQRLAMLAMQLNKLKRSSLNLKPSHIQKIDALWKLTSEISTDVRKVSHRLHPSVLDLLGLVAALTEFCNEFARLNDMKIEFVHRQVPTTLSQETTLCLYRVALEAIRNAQKHSGCREVRVELVGASNSVQLRVSDSGVGFDSGSVPVDRLGLVSMTERLRSLGGDLSVQSRLGAGTSIEARIPLDANRKQSGKVSRDEAGA